MNKSGFVKTALAAFTALCLSVPVLAFSGMGQPSGDNVNAGTKPAAEPKRDPNAVAAKINGKPILEKEVAQVVEAYLREVSSKMGGGHSTGLQANESIRKDMLKQVIDRELLFSEVEKHKYDGVDDKVKGELDTTKKNFPSEAEYKSALERDGMTEADLKKMIYRRFALEAYVEKYVAPKAVPTEKEAKKFYEDNPKYFKQEEMVKASHILVGIKPGDDDKAKAAAKAKAEDIRKKLVGGADFAELAKSSEDPGSKDQGGDLGYFTRGRMVPPFDEAAFALKVNELSPVVETQFGYHVIKVTDRKEAQQVPFDQVKDRILDHLKNVKISEALKAKVEELKKSSKIEIM